MSHQSANHKSPCPFKENPYNPHQYVCLRCGHKHTFHPWDDFHLGNFFTIAAIAFLVIVMLS